MSVRTGLVIFGWSLATTLPSASMIWVITSSCPLTTACSGVLPRASCAFTVCSCCEAEDTNACSRLSCSEPTKSSEPAVAATAAASVAATVIRIRT